MPKTIHLILQYSVLMALALHFSDFSEQPELPFFTAIAEKQVAEPAQLKQTDAIYSPPETIHLSLQYSNAVQVALLPHFSDFSEKLKLPISTPITEKQIAKFAPRRMPGDVGGTIFLTNGWRLGFYRGHVEVFESPHNYYTLQDPNRIAEFFGKVNLTTNEAVQLARKTLRQMEYEAKLEKTAMPPSTLEGPREWRGNTLPYYFIEWRWKTGDRDHVVNFGIDADKREVTKFFVVSTNLWSAPPHIKVIPELESEYRK